jgi:hypothetical protein
MAAMIVGSWLGPEHWPVWAHGASRGAHLHVEPLLVEPGGPVVAAIDASTPFVSFAVGWASSAPLAATLPSPARHSSAALTTPPDAASGTTVSIQLELRDAQGSLARAASLVTIGKPRPPGFVRLSGTVASPAAENGSRRSVTLEARRASATDDPAQPALDRSELRITSGQSTSFLLFLDPRRLAGAAAVDLLLTYPTGTTRLTVPMPSPIRDLDGVRCQIDDPGR